MLSCLCSNPLLEKMTGELPSMGALTTSLQNWTPLLEAASWPWALLEPAPYHS